MINNGDLTKVVKFTLVIYFENSNIVDWQKTVKVIVIHLCIESFHKIGKKWEVCLFVFFGQSE